MSIRSKVSSGPAKLAFGLGAAAALLWLFFRGTDTAAIAAALGGARPGLIALAASLMLSTYALRAVRWRLLLAPFGRASLWSCFVATVIGFAVNTFAGRLGEVVRPYLLARREGYPATGAFATIVVERVMDLVAVVLLIGVWLLIGPPPLTGESAVAGLKVGGAVGLAIAAVALGVSFVFARFPARSLKTAATLLAPLPERLRATLVRFLGTFTEGLGVLVDAGGFVRSIALSVGLWLVIALAFWIGARALAVTFSYGDTFLVIGFLTLGVAVPTPGAVGGYHYMCALALTTLFGTPDAAAKAVALTNHAIAFVPVTLVGIAFLPRVGLSLGQVRRLDRPPGPDDGPSGANDKESPT